MTVLSLLSFPFFVRGLAALADPPVGWDFLVPVLSLLIAGNLCVLELPPYRFMHLVTGIILFAGFFEAGPSILGLLLLAIVASEALGRGFPEILTNHPRPRLGLVPSQYFLPAASAGIVLGVIDLLREPLKLSYPFVIGQAGSDVRFFLILVTIYAAFTLFVEFGVGFRFSRHRAFGSKFSERDALVYLLAILLGVPIIWAIVRVRKLDGFGTLFAYGWMLWSFGAYGVAASLVRRQLEIERLVGAVAAQERLATLGRLASVIAHQTRHHIGVLNMSGYVLAETLGQESLSPKARDAVNSELQAISRTREELDKLLAQGFQSGKPAESFGLLGLARDCGEDLSPLMRTRSVTLSYRGDERRVCGDRLRLKQAITNVIRNAIEATPIGSEVTVELAGGPRMICLSVRDQGAGLSPAARGRLFEPLFTEKSDGLGMGLYVAREIVDAHGGELVLRNTDQGARAEIRLSRDVGVD